MRPVSFDRSRLPSGRTVMVLLVALVLTLTGLPFALAVDDEPADEALSTETAKAQATEAATDDPTVIPQDPPSEAPTENSVAQTETPVDTSVNEPVDTATQQLDVETVNEPALAPRTAPAALATTAPDGGDFSINWLASDPFSYSHVTGGGVFDTGSRDTTVESLNGGDFACGDLVSYLAAITVDDSTATDAATLQFTTSFATLTSSDSGIGHEEIVRAVINSGDPGMDGDASVVSLDRSTSGGDLIGVVTVDDLEAGEQIIVRIDVRLGCQTGGKNVGTIHASLDDIRVIAPTTEVVPGGAQTIPFKQDGVRRDLIVTKDVVGSAPAGTTYTVNVSCLKGDTATLTFTGDASQSAGQIPEGDTCTVTESDNGGADRTTVHVNNGTPANGTTASIVIGASNEVTFTNTFLAPTVTVGKSASTTTVMPDGTITYTITATNTATSAVAARGVTVTDDLDDDLAAVIASVSVGGGAASDCTVEAGNIVDCAVGTLAIGQSAVVTVTARATIAACGDVLNRASAAGTNFTTIQSPQVTVTVLCAPDINVLKTSSTTDTVPGDNFTYTITATNPSTATAAATGVTITDDLDDSLTGVMASYAVDSGGSQRCTVGTGNTVSCNVGTLAIGSSAVVTIQVTATPASCPSVSNRASVSGTNFSMEQSAQVDVTVTCTPALTVAKTASKTTVVPGESWEYEITVRSPASATATSAGVVVTDTLDASLDVARPTFSVNGGTERDCDVVGAGNTIRCAVGDLAPGDSAVVTIAATATVASCGQVVNVAMATATNITNAIGSNLVAVDVVCNPALLLDKTASAGTVDAGDDITYTITATNPAGSATATALGVVITDDLDDDLSGVAASVTNGATTAPCAANSGNGISCDAGDIAIGGEAVVTVTATTTEAACGVVTNTSTADGTNFTTVTSPTVDVTVVCPPVMDIVKSASTGTVVPGDGYTYTITATNSAAATGSAAEDLVITDDLDDGLTGVSASYSVAGAAAQPCDATGAGNTVRCDIGTLGIGDSVAVTIEATATVAACGVVTNVSTATGTNFTSITSNAVDVTVDCAPALELDKTASAGTVDAGDDITYTITATNPAGSATATALGVVITDDLDDDLTGVSGSVSNGATATACTVGTGNTLSCDAGDIAIGGEAVVTVTATTTEAACGVVTNTSTADGTNVTTVTSPTIDVTVVCPPVIEVVKSASAGTVDVGDTYTYTITTSNVAGPTGSTAEDVVVTDDLDDDLGGVTASFQVGAGPEQDCDPTGAGNTVRCALGDLPLGASADITIVAVATLDACGSVTNVSTASGTNFTTATSNVVDVLIPCPTPPSSISLVKTGSAPSRDVGDLITYTYEITNTGQSTLTEITLDDDILGVITVPKTTLTAGESMEATATHLITLDDVEATEVVNVATTTGRTPEGGTVEDTDDEVIPIPGAPSILLEKTPNTEVARVGETVTYEYVITNNGTTRLTDITLVDDKIGTIVSVDEMLALEPGESTTVEAQYTVTEADAARGDTVVNVAIVSGLPPTGRPVTSTDRATVEITILRTLDLGQVRVVKQLDGDGSPAEGATFGFSVDCTTTAVDGSRFTLPAAGGTHDVETKIPVGETCTVTETRDAGAEATTVAVGTAAPRESLAADVTITKGVTTVTFVNTFGTRPIIPPIPPPPPPPDLPATGAGLTLQLLIGMGALAIGAAMVRRFRPVPGSGPSGRRGPLGWSSRA